MDYEDFLESGDLEEMDKMLVAAQAENKVFLDNYPDMTAETLLETCVKVDKDPNTVYRIQTTPDEVCGTIENGIMKLCPTHFDMLLEKRSKFPGTNVKVTGYGSAVIPAEVINKIFN